MVDKGFGDTVFGEGISLTLWSGNFTRANPTAPGVFSPFYFKEIEPLGLSQREQSLILSMVLGTKGDLSKSLEEMKASSKVETMVPIDYYGFIYQMKSILYNSWNYPLRRKHVLSPTFALGLTDQKIFEQ
jgi:hypothetical protein